MERAEVKTIVEAALPIFQSRLGLDHWTIKVDYDLRSDEPGLTTYGWVHCLEEYETARIRINPEAHVDEPQLLDTLQHELLHVVHSSFDLYREAVKSAVLDGIAQAMLEKVWHHACEKTVVALQRMYSQLDAPRRAAAEAAVKPKPKGK